MSKPADPTSSDVSTPARSGLQLKMLAPKTRDALMSVATRVEVSAGEALFHEGESGNSLYVIKSGRVTGVRVGRNESGEDWPVLHLSAGEIVGEMSFMDGGPRHITARAETDCVVLKVCPEDLLVLEGGDMFYDNLRAAVGITVVQRLRAGTDIHVATLDQHLEVTARNEELLKLSITDKLTGLFNRTKLDDAFLIEFERCRRYKSALSIIVFDVDHFKKVNDTFGHQKGDDVLVGVSAILKDTIRAVDIPGRWGGEEFLVICPETDVNGARTLAEAIRKAVEDHVFAGVGRVTASFGVAAFAPDDGVASLIERADQALYRAKRGGRNRVEIG